MPQLINPFVWCVFAINLTYDDSYYQLNEEGVLKYVCATEEQANFLLAKVKTEYLTMYKDCYVDGFGSSNNYTAELINTYCHIKKFELL